MEPEWTRQISNPMICNFFYVFFVVYAIFFVLSLLFTIGVFSYSSKMGKMGIVMGTQALFITFLGGLLMLFYYLICDRALLGKAVQDIKEKFENKRMY
jgi:uncharacterized RDD family membrane protein YckC